MESAAKLPFVHIDREEFLTKNLSKLCTKTQLQKAIVEGMLHAGIPIATLDSLANHQGNHHINSGRHTGGSGHGCYYPG
jgi:hypothetical protein